MKIEKHHDRVCLTLGDGAYYHCELVTPDEAERLAEALMAASAAARDKRVKRREIKVGEYFVRANLPTFGRLAVQDKSGVGISVTYPHVNPDGNMGWTEDGDELVYRCKDFGGELL